MNIVTLKKIAFNECNDKLFLLQLHAGEQKNSTFKVHYIFSDKFSFWNLSFNQNFKKQVFFYCKNTWVKKKSTCLSSCPSKLFYLIFYWLYCLKSWVCMKIKNTKVYKIFLFQTFRYSVKVKLYCLCSVLKTSNFLF